MSRAGLVGALGGLGVAALATASDAPAAPDMPTVSGPPVGEQVVAKAGPRRLLVFLHGYGGSADDFGSLARELVADAPGDEPVLLEGPQPAAGGVGRQWWDVRVRSDDARAVALASAGDGLRSWLDTALRERGLRDEDVVLIGFSQGAALAMSVGARWRLGGVVAYSGRPVELPDGPVATPFLLVVGGRDPWLPAADVHDFAARLRARGASVVLQIHPELGHGLDRRSVAETLAFLGARGGVMLKSGAGGAPPHRHDPPDDR